MVGKLRNPSDRSNASNVSQVSGAANKEYFWACDLTANKRTQKWHVTNDELEDDDEDYIEHTLVIRSVCLGAGAVEKEENILVMESVGEDGEVFKGTIANLTKGVNPMVGNLSLTVDGKSGVTFTLVEGSGPVSICGNRLLDYPEDDDLDASQTDDSLPLDETEDLEEGTEEDEEDEEDESFVEEKVKPKQAAKRKAPVTKSSKGKQKAKMEEDDDEDDDEEDDDEEEEESDSDVKVKKAKKDAGKNATSKAKHKMGNARNALQVNGNGKASKKAKK